MRGVWGAQFVATFTIIPNNNRGLEEKETLWESEVTVVDENEIEGSDKEDEQEEQTEPVNVVEQTDEEDSESETSSSECEMSEEETFKSINRIIEYEIEYVSVVKWVLLSLKSHWLYIWLKIKTQFF